MSPAEIGSGVPRVLVEGELEILGAMSNSSNHTFLARASGDATAGVPDLLSIYKPRRGESPLWDFPNGTLCKREVAAYIVAAELGWPSVPPTVLRQGPFGVGSVQLFVEFDPEHHYFTLERSHPQEFREVALFDLVVNNADRKAGHCLLGADGKIWIIDHGVCFNEEPKLRTVIWEFVGEPIPPGLKADLDRLGEHLNEGQELRAALSELLSEDEIGAMSDRLASILREGVFPEPGEGRPFPWPPI
jgi:uncharacterized repeat protein (TIGR03843 family)